LRIHYKGRDLGDWGGWPTLQEARRIKTMVGMRPHEFRKALFQDDPDALACLAVIMLARHGEEATIDDIDGDNCIETVIPILTDEERAAIKAVVGEDEGKAEQPKADS